MNAIHLPTSEDLRATTRAPSSEAVGLANLLANLLAIVRAIFAPGPIRGLVVATMLAAVFWGGLWAVFG